LRTKEQETRLTLHEHDDDDDVSVALGIRHATRMRHIVIGGLPGYTIFFHILIKTVRFSKKVTEGKMCVLVSSTISIRNFLILTRTDRDRSKMHIGLHVKCHLFLSDLNEA
jgi:hypothetical protein